MKKLLLSLLLCSATTFAAGLSGGDQYSTQNIYGRLNVQCMGPQGSTTAFADCRGQILNPGEYSYFVGPKSEADSVTLVATHENGSVSKAKTEKYDGQAGKSKKSFNLWISTVLQRPLLDFGKNTVKYTLSENGRVTEQGTFVVTVVDGGRSVCQRIGYYTSASSSDCQFPSNLCSRYFSENNYCQ
jgi:hypothetical protein